MDLVSKIAIKLSCVKVGFDEFGNQYFETKPTKKGKTISKKKRYVIYNGLAEPSKVPANWHSWLHYTSDDLPDNSHKYSWQKIHLPNLTGTKFAYFPPSKNHNCHNSIASSGYKPWKPINN